MKIILDSNVLFIPFTFNVDILEELARVTNRKIEAILLSPVYEELKMLSTKAGIQGRRAALALEYAKKLKLINIETKPGETVDELILRIAIEWRCPVSTNDQILRKKLRKTNIPVIYLRQKSHLEIDGHI